MGGGSNVLQGSCLGAVLRFFGIFSNSSSGGVTENMTLNVGETSNKHVFKDCSELKHKNARNNYETYHKRLEKPVVNIPPFPYPVTRTSTSLVSLD